MENNTSENYNFLSNCSFCNGNFHQRDIVVAARSNQRTILHAVCPKCKISTLMIFSGHNKEIIGVGLATDLDRIEVNEKVGSAALDGDGILDAYKTISKNCNLEFLLKNN